MPVGDRDDVDNLMLARSLCHTEIDKKRVEGVLDVDLLRDLRRRHDADIKTQTGLLRDSSCSGSPSLSTHPSIHCCRCQMADGKTRRQPKRKAMARSSLATCGH